MQRRTYLRSVGAASIVLATGCLGRGSADTVLDPPSHDVDSEALSYPAYGEQLPEVKVPSPLHDRKVTTTEFIEDRHVLMTFVFSRCHGPCPILTATLAQIQAHATKNDYTEEVALLPVTFDPEFDTEEVLRTFSEERGADPTTENWQFLRPRTEERAKEVVNNTFGIGFEKTEAYTDGARDQDENSDTDNSEQDGDMKDMFVHVTLIILANKAGYVERAYKDMPQPNTIINDLATVREGGDEGFW